ncbi:MAG: flagellar hook-basal body protein [Lachnospiraceae bacterium]|nr:flagellar hook-basal body protein [Lachnospiraceae bacterium]
MVKGLYTAYTGMVEEMRRLDVISNNMANSDTTGYKREGTVNQAFDAQLAFKIKDTSEIYYARGVGDVNMGVKVGETYTDYSQGSYEVTDIPTDLALDGNGFFAIEFTAKDGTKSIKYTRDGDFSINTQGYLVTTDGDYVLSYDGAMNSTQGSYIQVDPNLPITVDEQGFISQDNEIVARVGYVDFADYNYLEKYGENLYNLIDGGTIQASTAKVNQGVLEVSNVNIVNEMVELITITRAYEANQKIIQTIDQTLDKAVNQVGRVG